MEECRDGEMPKWREGGGLKCLQREAIWIRSDENGLFQRKDFEWFYRFSEHAVKRMIKRSISRHEVESIIRCGEIIEEYIDDKYSPSCLIFGKTESGRNIHVLLSETPVVVIITVYEPDPTEWINGKIRG